MSVFKLFTPTMWVKRIVDIKMDTLIKLGIHAVLVDLDDTICPASSDEVSQKTLDWVWNLKKQGVILAIVSNNCEERVERFSKQLNIPFLSKARKPLTFKVKGFINSLQINKNSTIVVGDQIFTDILLANILGLKSILVNPLSQSSDSVLRFKRYLERNIKSKIIPKNFD